MSTGIYVDVVKNYYSVLSLDKRARIDYSQYLKAALNGEQLHRAFAYGVQIEDEAASFIVALTKIGYNVKYKKARMIHDNENIYRPSIKQTNWLIGMTLDVVRNINFVDHIILGFNDPSIVDLIHWIKEKGIKVTMYGVNIGSELRMVSDNTREITDDVLEYKNDID